MTKSVNKLVILLVALLMCATVVFAACNNSTFKAVDKPDKAIAESNGGIAVKYGEYLYYVNGYTSDVSADNTYSNDVVDAPRIGSVVRIRLSEIEKILAINDDKDLTSSEKSTKIASAVRGELKNDEDTPIEGAVTVIPKIYYSGNTTTTQFTGIYIFNDRIYVTTPNDELTANGDPLTNQLKLMSFDMGGGDPQTHYTFTSNSAQIWLTCDYTTKKVIATYLMDNILHKLDVESGTDTVVSLANDPASDVDNTVSSVNWDQTENKESVFFLDKFGSICKLPIGESNYEVIVENKEWKLHEHDGESRIENTGATYTIKFVNSGIVYYTVAKGDDTVTDNVVMYWAESAENNGNVALPVSSLSLYVWKTNKYITTDSYKSGEKTYYSICIVTVGEENGKATYTKSAILKYGENDSSITINKLEGSNLYYTSNSISYVIDLDEAEQAILNNGTPRAKNIASTTGWAAPDFVNYTTKVDGEDVTYHYIISASTNTVTLTKFNPDNIKSNNVSIALTLTAAPEDK